MREIKFRAWNKDWRKMQEPEDFAITGEGKVYSHESEIAGKEVSVYDTSNEWRGLILMQFTGLLDKSGKEIYEGDIVENEAIRDEVTFHKGAFRLRRNLTQTLSDHEGLKVIGNIYEHKNLLT